MFYHNLITYYIKIWYCRYGCNTCRCISSVWDVNSELPHLIVFSSREILQLICFDDSADYYFITCIVSVTPSNCEFLVGSCYVIDLQVSLVCPRPFICLRYVPASIAGNESFVTMYFRFSAVAAVGWKHLTESQYARNVLCIYADRKRKSLRYAPSR